MRCRASRGRQLRHRDTAIREPAGAFATSDKRRSPRGSDGGAGPRRARAVGLRRAAAHPRMHIRECSPGWPRRGASAGTPAAGAPAPPVRPTRATRPPTPRAAEGPFTRRIASAAHGERSIRARSSPLAAPVARSRRRARARESDRRMQHRAVHHALRHQRHAPRMLASVPPPNTNANTNTKYTCDTRKRGPKLHLPSILSPGQQGG